MNREVQKKLVLWKKKLLDLGKRNRLLNYKDTKRGSLKIEMPEFSEFYKLIVNDEKKLKFAHVYITQRNAASVFDESDGDESEINYNELPGDIKTFCSVKEAEQTLNNLRKKARTAMEEQGVNILYLSFGFLEWYEAEKSKVAIRSPIILVPVCLELETLNDPYVISLHEDEIVVNPTLAYKLEHDFGLELPEFDPSVKDAAEYVDKINKAVEKYGWTTQKEVTLSLLSFLKINMYNDLEEHAELIGNHPVIRALSDLGYEAGEAINGIETQDHDKLRSPKDVFQVVDADSSQLDAIEMSKQGVSFVLQGPPGTGKSQTITNIIAEALADNKKVLFVSEKMAALEVVHNRLSASGLADFCLVLHSSKANKRELLDSLRKVIELKPISVTDEALYKLDTLKTYRNSLNEYAEQLHKIIEPLGQSLFYAQSLIAANQNTQDLIFEIKNTNIRDVTKEQFFTYRRVLEQFVRSRHSLSSDYSENVWRYCNLRNITHEARHDISSRLDSLTDLLKTFLAGSDEIKKKTELNVMISYNSLNEIRSFIDLCGEGETFPVQWIEDLSFDELTQKAERFNSTKKEAEQLRETVRKDCKDDIFHLNADDIVQKISATIDSIAEISSDTNISVNGLLKDYEIRSSDIRLENEKLISLQRIMNKIPKQAGIRCPSALDDIKELCTLLDAFDSEMRPCSSWFRSAERNSNAISDSLEALSKQIDKTNEIQNRITETWDKSVLNIDHQSIRMRFRTEYGSIFRALKKNYKEDAQNLKGYYTGNKKCSYDDYCRLLDMLGEYSNACEEISINDPIYKRDLGQWYNGKDTDVAAVNKAISEFNTVCRYYNGSVPEYLRNILLSYSNEGMFVSECNELRQFTEDDQIVKLISGSVDMKTDDQCDLMTLSKKTQQICGKLDKLEEIFETIKPYMASELLYDEIYSRLGALSVIQRSEQEIQDLNNELEKDYGRFFNGFDTDWQNIIAKLAWVRRLKSFSDKLHLSFGFISKCAGEEQQYTFLKEYRTLLNDFSSSADKIIIWLDTLFEEPVLIKEMDFASLSEHAQKCRLHLKELEEWIDFCECRRQCEEQGLDDFIETVLQNNVANEQVLPVFIKRFERVWIDSVINECPAVALFRTRNQENTITKFRELDHEQFSIASVRIRERLIRQIPNIHSFTSSKDEVAVLMREMSKQRKIMPVRKLFSSIPMLLPRLKPCLMMSPLSVSLFLQSDHYKFDMVIFDEASQVRTENAIGAISRGTQVIIAGDTHQLPPTSFFTSAVSNSDEYIEEEDDSEAYESVLDETSTILPQLMLKWHYRSRDEALIAFSNQKIYHSSLITFPSPQNDNVNSGISFVYVPEGIYERSTRRCNPIEAKRVADVIFSEIKRYPDRSIGVITFSEAQQRCVETAVIERRLREPQYESFFAEKRESPFFVKSLENVQGDERDTIIFSIGYGKSSPLEKLYMNFGPINQGGGYRRLNVAVTRAKSSIKVVSSILPTDMIISDSTPKGVKLLRDYLEYALKGVDYLKAQLEYSDEVNTESVFEDAVYNFLERKGYDVVTQVGCSGYRIDMAVKHPEAHGRFVLGIECDGAAYHSSRTARERDRLRQSVLESMGWKIYRIWSTDWIKDPISEGEALVNAIDKAISDSHEAPVIPASVENDLEAGNALETYAVEQTNNIITDSDKNEGFEYYNEIVFPKKSFQAADSEIADAIRRITDEQSPVHIQLICKQVAPLYCNQKVTVKVSDGVEIILRRLLRAYAYTRKGDFIWKKGQTEIIPKIPKPRDKPRPMEFIAAEELKTAMEIIIKRSLGLDTESLYRLVSKQYGFSRISSSMKESLDNAFALLQKSKKLFIAEDKISWQE